MLRFRFYVGPMRAEGQRSTLVKWQLFILTYWTTITLTRLALFMNLQLFQMLMASAWCPMLFYIHTYMYRTIDYNIDVAHQTSSDRRRGKRAETIIIITSKLRMRLMPNTDFITGQSIGTSGVQTSQINIF